HANFDDPAYRHTVKQSMALPKVQRLQIAKHRGRAAYDLLSQQPLEINKADEHAETEQTIELDLRRIQGAMIAFTPEPIERLQTHFTWNADSGQLTLRGELLGATGKAMNGVFPVRITLRHGQQTETFERVLGPKTSA